jgi:predicted unusual protein kinase regulating ubiquinone biosynthesis (AarF/ABC1/UbiB family)
MTEIKNVSYGEVRELGAEFNDLLYAMPFQVPQDFIYLGRAMGILSGMATSLDPHFNPWEEIQPYAQKLLAISLTNGHKPQTGGDLFTLPTLESLFNGNGAQVLAEMGKTLLSRAITFPQQVDNVLDRADRGELTLRVTPTTTFRKHLNRIEAQGRRTTRAVIFGSLLVSSTLLYTNGDVLPAAIGYLFSGITLLSLLVAGE